MMSPTLHTYAPENDWVAVVAVANTGVIGRGQTLPWKMSSDLQRFKRMTMGHCLLMGRNTFESIGRPLPGRQTLVLSRSGFRSPAGVQVVRDLEEVAAHVEPGRRVMVVGGAQIYAIALPYCSTIWLTRVLADIDGDVYFPSIDWTQWRQESCEAVAASERDQWPSEFQIWKRST